MNTNRVSVAKRAGQWIVFRHCHLMGLIPVRAAVYRARDYDDAQQWANECAWFYRALEEWGASPVVDR